MLASHSRFISGARLDKFSRAGKSRLLHLPRQTDLKSALPRFAKFFPSVPVNASEIDFKIQS